VRRSSSTSPGFRKACLTRASRQPAVQMVTTQCCDSPGVLSEAMGRSTTAWILANWTATAGSSGSWASSDHSLSPVVDANAWPTIHLGVRCRIEATGRQAVFNAAFGCQSAARSVLPSAPAPSLEMCAPGVSTSRCGSAHRPRAAHRRARGCSRSRHTGSPSGITRGRCAGRKNERDNEQRDACEHRDLRRAQCSVALRLRLATGFVVSLVLRPPSVITRRRNKRRLATVPDRDTHKIGRGREVHAWQTLTGAVARLAHARSRTASGNAGRFLFWTMIPADSLHSACPDLPNPARPPSAVERSFKCVCPYQKFFCWP
jgi:hypothetical protein